VLDTVPFQQGVVIAGIPIPSSEPWFLAIVGLHVVAGLVAVVAGAVAMLSRKGPGRHPKSGSIYFWALVVITLTMGVLTVARWPANNHLAVIGILSVGTVLLGRRARRNPQVAWQRVHIPSMGLSYVLMLTAFYVDNGPHLPLWNRLPNWSFWFLPATVGLPLIGLSLRRYWNELPLRDG
jgi:uncharacterized membrane protein